MFDRVLLTGTLSKPEPVKKREPEGDVESPNPAEQAEPSSNQEGVILVVVRELTDQRQLDQYLLHGYRLAETKHFAHVFADRVG